jgi:hypothetical protein
VSKKLTEIQCQIAPFAAGIARDHDHDEERDETCASLVPQENTKGMTPHPILGTPALP